MQLISGKGSLTEFCEKVINLSYCDIIYKISFELHTYHKLYFSKKHHGKEGSYPEQQQYCDDLQKLLSALMNGSFNENIRDEFIVAVAPLFNHIMETGYFTGGNIEEKINEVMKKKAQLEAELWTEVGPLVIVVSKEDILAGNIEPTLGFLKTFLENPAKVRMFRERLNIAFHGYDDTSLELDEIPEVRDFVCMLDEEFPYWLYFLSKYFTGLQCVMHCFLLPFLTPEASAIENPQRLGSLLESRWFPAMNYMAELAGDSEEIIEHITEKVVNYIKYGPSYFTGEK